MKDTSDLSNNWLQRLKDESWEAELLVSAIAIFGTFQLFKFINGVTNYFIDVLHPSQYLIGYFIVFFGLVAISVLVSMFVIHFFLRAYWIGLVGLNSVFPDYSIKDSQYSRIYTEKTIASLPKLKDSIKKIDDLCSVIFSVAFSFLLMFMYIAFFTSIYLLIYSYLSAYINKYILLFPAGLLIFLVYFQIAFALFANRKKYKENEKIQNRFFQISKLTNILILGPLYKMISQVIMILGSNFKKNKGLVYLVIAFVTSGFFIATSIFPNTNIPYLIVRNNFFDNSTINDGYYKNENENISFLLTPEIESDIIENSTFKLFIPIYKHEKNMRKDICITNKKDNDSTSLIDKIFNKKYQIERANKKGKQKINCYNKYNHIFLNGQKLTTEFWRNNHHRTDQKGIICYINLKNAAKGLNYLKIVKDYDSDDNTEWTIPFQYLPKS